MRKAWRRRRLFLLVLTILFLISDAGSYDRLVIQDILKEIAQTQQVDQNARHRFKGESVATQCGE